MIARPIIALLVVAGTAAAVPVTAPIEAKANLLSSRIAVDPSGANAVVVYATAGAVRIVTASGAPAGTVPTGKRATVDGVVVGGGVVTVLAHERFGCAPLFVLARDATGTWTRTALGITARTATIANDQAGTPTVAAIRCADGAVLTSTRLDASTWAPTDTVPGVIVGPNDRLSLAAAGSALLVGVSGGRAAILRRDGITWSRLPLPGDPLAATEVASTVTVGFDSILQAIAFIVRSPRFREPLSTKAPGLIKRSVSRYAGLSWQQVAGATNPVGLVANAQAFGVLEQGGDVLVEAGGAVAISSIRPRRLAIGPTGAIGQVIAGPRNATLQVGV